MNEENSSILEGLSEYFPKERYEAIEELGRGANGVVFLCRDKILRKKVAIKLLHNATSDSIMDFQKEAKIASSLSHRGIVKVLDFSAETGRPYLVMDYLIGKSLNSFVKRNGTLDFEDFRYLATELCEALSYAHGREIVHRDLKPANILLTEGGVTPCVILDFGLARKKDLGFHTLTGMIIGTPLYMSPEQARGEPATRQSDVYSLGCIFHFMLTGKPPYTEQQFQECLINGEGALPPINTGYEPVDKIIAQMLKVDRHERYATTLQVKIALNAVPAPEPTYAETVASNRYTGMFTARKPVREKRQAFAMIAAAMSLIVVVLFLLQFSGFMQSGAKKDPADNLISKTTEQLIDPDLENGLKASPQSEERLRVALDTPEYSKTFNETLKVAKQEWAQGQPRIKYGRGSFVAIDVHGVSYPARVLQVRQGIHYVSYLDDSDRFWDEWVPPSRIHEITEGVAKKMRQPQNQ